MKDTVIRITDRVQILSSSVDNFRRSLQDNYVPTSTQALRVDIVATHAGRITRNWGFYLPQNMKDGIASWTENYNKPFLVHHDSHSDPIGRIVSARYVDTAGSLIKDERLATFINILCNKQFPFIQKVRAFDQFKDSEIAQNPDFPGLGYTILTVDITDKDAIQKVLDKRYLTVSIGAQTDKAVCSVCNADWTDEICDHRPGKEYEGKKMFLIAGKLRYEECSAVNNPADPDAKIVTIHNGVIQNSITVENCGAYSVNAAQFSFTDVLGGRSMADTQPTPEVTPAPVAEIKSDPAPVVTDSATPPAATPQDAVVPPAPTPEVLPELSDEDKHYNDMIALGYELGLVDTGFEDAELSPEKRKGMSKSSFCKPGERKYPVPDCSHARSAMAYAKKYNEPTAVLACIRRKAKALGCPFDEAEIDAILADEAKRSAAPAPVTTPEDTTVTPAACSCKECEEKLNDATKKLAALQSEFDALTDSHTKLNEEIRTKLTNQIVEVQKLAGVTDTEALLKDIAVLSVDDLIKRATASAVSTPKTEPASAPATDVVVTPPKEPQGTVEDPTLRSDDVENDPYSAYRVKYLKMRDLHGDRAADAFLNSLKQGGLVPVDFSIDTNN